MQAQYTETINSNRPGASQGAFSVGTGVLQIEAGGYYGNDNHNLRATDTDILGADYALRYGLLFEALEISLIGSFQSENTKLLMGGSEVEFSRSDFRTNTLGAKYLIFDPSRSIKPDKPNLYSWKANQKFKWKTLIPAIAVYAGANFSFGENPYLSPGESTISPKFILSTQNNWAGGWVFVSNFILDKIADVNPTYAGIFTLTHAFTPEFAGFLEYQGIISNIYADDLARVGVAYLVGRNLQFDVSGLINFKNTPSRWQVAGGFSYRFDMHTQDEVIEDDFDGDRSGTGAQQLQQQIIN
ncbi:transporter [Antarcticibacterium sp. 1MA-6-2]|uniref:transporter n=1 Tax=Antarcticibacterium sp. 1MA-6-2 TaxID=2908210 RepID=UPI001F2AF0D6|nr:transporter [Antarcticibacterium sp. 1MA-6-2]UJH91531.1 transporter [Antarcticibacterium sp. 1MA-6-2]